MRAFRIFSIFLVKQRLQIYFHKSQGKFPGSQDTHTMQYHKNPFTHKLNALLGFKE